MKRKNKQEKNRINNFPCHHSLPVTAFSLDLQFDRLLPVPSLWETALAKGIVVPGSWFPQPSRLHSFLGSISVVCSLTANVPWGPTFGHPVTWLSLPSFRYSHALTDLCCTPDVSFYPLELRVSALLQTHTWLFTEHVRNPADNGAVKREVFSFAREKSCGRVGWRPCELTFVELSSAPPDAARLCFCSLCALRSAQRVFPLASGLCGALCDSLTPETLPSPLEGLHFLPHRKNRSHQMAAVWASHQQIAAPAYPSSLPSPPNVEESLLKLTPLPEIRTHSLQPFLPVLTCIWAKRAQFSHP